MSVYVERLLGDHHLLKCLEISKIKSRVSGTTPVSDDAFNTSIAKFFKENDNHYAFGCFENNKLISWIGIVLKEDDVRGKFWCITSLYTTKFTTHFSFDNEEVGLLIKTVFELAESKKYYEYYYSVSARVSKVYEKKIQKNKFRPSGIYDLVEVATIPANTEPSEDLYWRLMGKELKPDTIIIKKRIMRSQFRQE
jgi:hypothetical protein